jgi:Tfp pilus assembly protein PilO
MSNSEKLIMMLINLCIVGLVWYFLFRKDKVEPTNNLQQEQINLDSIKAYYNVKIDSVNTANLILKSKIKDKNEIIYTLKSLVNDNNKKYQVITDSALVVELEKERAKGIR